MNEEDGGFYDRVGINATPRNRLEPPGFDTLAAVQPTEPTGVRLGHAVKVRRWSYNGDTHWPASETTDRLDAGFYRFDHQPNIGPCVIRSSISVDNLIRLPDTAAAEVLSEFAQFWTLRERFAARGFLHKRGILLWGPPGSGKTSSLMQMAADIIAQHEGIVCQIENAALAGACLQQIRKIEPDRPIVALIEDLDALVNRHGENEYLSLLDGEAQVDRIVFVATTNYPERLDKRFVDRPSRFDTVRWIGMPTAAARRVYLQAKEPSLQDDELQTWVRETDGFSVAHLRELVILVKCFGRSLDQAIARLERMRVKPDSEQAPDRPSFGIIGGGKF